MKMRPGFRNLVLSSLLTLYLSGLLIWMFSHWFFVSTGFGAEPSPTRLWWLEFHTVTGLWFLVLFGYLFHSHIQPSWRNGKKRVSGVLLSGSSVVLMLTVPVLFYATNDHMKNITSILHTYLGLSALIIFIYHRFSRKT